MTIAQALRRGIQTLRRNQWLWWIFYAVATLPALVLAGLAMTVAFDSLGHSAWAAQLGKSFDWQWIGELIAAGTLPVEPVLVAFAVTFCISSVIGLFLLGGALNLFGSGEPFSLQSYFAGCGKHFWRLVRLALVSVIFYVAVALIAGGLNAMGQKIWGEGSEATPLVYWRWFRAGVLVCLLGFVNLVFDYARLRLIADDSRKAFRAGLGSFRFVWRNFGRTAGLYVTIWAVALVCLAAYSGFSRAVSQSSALGVGIVLIARQVLVLARVWWRLLFYSAQAEMYASLKPVPLPPPEPDPEPEAAPVPPEPLATERSAAVGEG